MLIMIILASIVALLPLYFIKKYIQTNKKKIIGIVFGIISINFLK